VTGTVLVTGCAGFIGARVVARFLDEGYNVAGIDSLNDVYDVRLKQWRLNQLQKLSGFKFTRLDIRDTRTLSEYFAANKRREKSPFDAVIHLAARAGVRQSIQEPQAYFEHNVTGSINVLQLSVQTSVPKFVLASSSSLYGAGNTGMRAYCESDTTDMPLSPYASSKKAAETLAYTYHYLYGLDVSALRFFTVYGPAGRPDMSPFRFVRWICEGEPVAVYGDGSQNRDFTYVDDIAAGTLAALKPLGYEIINLGSDRPVVLNEAIGFIERAAGKKAIVRYEARQPGDVVSTWANIQKAGKLLEWRPTTSFEQGIEQTVRWYLDNRQWAHTISIG